MNDGQVPDDISLYSDDGNNSVGTKYSDYQSIIDDSRYEFGDYKMYCKHCFETIKSANDCVKSVLWNGEGCDIVLFCNTECVDNFDWKKYKCRKRRRRSIRKSRSL